VSPKGPCGKAWIPREEVFGGGGICERCGLAGGLQILFTRGMPSNALGAVLAHSVFFWELNLYMAPRELSCPSSLPLLPGWRGDHLLLHAFLHCFPEALATACT
jgi:hypothetical protein